MSDIKVEKLGGYQEEPIGGFNHRTIKVALLSWFSLIAAPKPLQDITTPLNEGTTFEEISEITGPHTFKTGYGFMTIEAIQEEVEIASDPIGTKKGMLFENKATINVAGSNAKLLGFGRWVKNKDVIVLIEEVGTGNVRQIGAERFAASIKVSGKIEKNGEGTNIQTYEVSDKQVYMAPIYKGVITDMPAPI